MGTNKIAFLMTVGPGEAAMAIDSLESVRFNYPHDDIWILDDCTQDGTFEELKSWSEKNHAYLVQNTTPNGYFGLLKSLKRLFNLLLDSSIDYKYVIKMDTDAYILSPKFKDYLNELFAVHGPGMIGAYKYSPNGGQRVFTRQFVKVITDVIPVRQKLSDSKLVIGKSPLVPFFLKALKNGYIPGEHVLGGTYALHYETLVKLKESSFLDKNHELSKFLKEEDIIISLAVKSVGHSLIEINQKNPLATWLQYKSPIPIDADYILKNNIMALHPLKNDEKGNEIRKKLKIMIQNNNR